METDILHVIARMNVGGTARYVGELIENIPRSRLACGFVQGSELEDSCLQNLDVIRVPSLGRKISIVKDLLAWIELKRIVKKEKPSIIHTHTFKAGMIGRLIPGEHKLVHTFHGHLFDDQSFSSFQKFSIRLIEKILARRTDLLISVGEKVGREIREAGIGVGENWGSISPGVTALPKYSKSKARKALGLTETGKLVGWMARMTEVKNPFRLLEISRSMPNVNFVMAGGGNLLELVRQYAPSNVHIIGWTDASQFWSAIDCVVSTSDNEGMPIALIEAQLASLPVVCTNAGSSEEVILDGVTGYVRERNALDLKEALEKVIYDESLIKAMGAKGRSHATEKFSLKKMISLHKYYYGNLISNSKPN